MTQISGMTPLGSLPSSNALVPVVEAGNTTNYVYDLGADLASRPHTSDVTAISTNLASNSDATKGAALVGFSSSLTYAANTVGSFLKSLLASTGSSLIGFLQSGTGAVARTVSSKLGDVLSLKDFGAKGDGVTDDTAAIQAWLNAGASGLALYAPFGTYCFSSALSLTNPTGISIRGDGPFATVFKYTGATTTVDLLNIGSNAGAQTNNVSLSGFRVTSSTVMTGGTGLHLQNFCRSILNNVIIDGQDGSGNLYNGIWFDQVDCVVYDGFIVSASNVGLRVNGGSGLRPKADLFLDNGKICPSNSKTMAIGIHVGGAFGGLQIGAVDIIGSATNMVVDTTIAAESNREINFTAGSALDSSTTGPNLLLNDTQGGTVYVSANGAWFASAHTDSIVINSTSTNYKFIMAGGRIYNNTGNGLTNNSSIAEISITGAEINNNTGTGIANPGAGKVKIIDPNFAGNGTNTSGNADVFVDNGANGYVVGNIITSAAAPTVASGQLGFGATTATSATAGTNGAVPTQVLGYLVMNLAGTTIKVPYYAA